MVGCVVVEGDVVDGFIVDQAFEVAGVDGLTVDLSVEDRLVGA